MLKAILPQLPWIVSVIVGIVLFFTYKKVRGYLSLIAVLINSIEIIDEQIQDIVGDKAMAVMKKIKSVVNLSLKPDDKVRLDKLLREKGYMV